MFLSLSGSFGLTTNVSAQIICWNDDNGRRVCGDSVPASQAQRDRQILNERGIVVRQEQGAPSEEELAARAAEEQARIVREREAAERLRYGQALLDSYTSVDAIEALRDRTVAQIEGQRTIIQANLDSLHDKLETLDRQSQRYAPYNEAENARPLPEILIRDIEATKSSIQMFEIRLEENFRKGVEETEKFEKDIAYFRELQRIDG